jgi:UDP-N-acetylmuramyl pentapeptide synthase
MPATLSLNKILATLAPQMRAPDTFDFQVNAVSIDSRHTSDNSLFVALRGEQRDGHDFVIQAFANGACLALTEHPVPGIRYIDCLGLALPDELHPPLTLIVPNSLVALQVLS